MTRPAVLEYAAALRPRYGVAGRKEKQRILDEFCETTGMHRKAAIRLLNRQSGPLARKLGRPRRYGPEVTEALAKVWEVGDRMCSKLLVAVMPELVEALERHGELAVTAEVRSQLLQISPASIDRLLRRHRRGLGLQPRRPSSPAGSLKAEIPVRTWSEWKGVEVGSVQADLVLHCGESTEGFYLTTLCAVDVATGWTELQPVWGHGQQRVGTAVHLVRERLPFALKSLHTDNGSEFINHILFSWCRREGVHFTRGRSYRKNDQAYVEQRNWLTVRRQVGYERFTSKRALALFNQLYPLLCLQLNFFRPIRKLVAKERVGGRVLKRYDEPRTAYLRLIDSGALSVEARAAVEATLRRINPARLQRRIDDLLRQLWNLGREERKLAPKTG
jgi:hypothetical protein